MSGGSPPSVFADSGVVERDQICDRQIAVASLVECRVQVNPFLARRLADTGEACWETRHGVVTVRLDRNL